MPLRQRDGNGGMRGARVGRLHLTCLTCLTGLTRGGAPRYTPRVCCTAVWFGSGQIYRWGMQGLFDGNGGVPSAWAWRLHEICGNYEIYERGMGAPRYTPWVCLPLCGWARGKFTVGVCKACLMATAVCRLRGRGACI